MKKSLKKLRLNRETLRNLDRSELSQAAGGNHLTVSRTHEPSNCSYDCCGPTETCTTTAYC